MSKVSHTEKSPTRLRRGGTVRTEQTDTTGFDSVDLKLLGNLVEISDNTLKENQAAIDRLSRVVQSLA